MDIDQQDTIVGTTASVDVCPTICDFGVDGIFGDEVFEQFTETLANAVFINIGTARHPARYVYGVRSGQWDSVPHRAPGCADPEREVFQFADDEVRSRQPVWVRRDLRSERDGPMRDPALRLCLQRAHSRRSEVSGGGSQHRSADSRKHRPADVPGERDLFGQRRDQQALYGQKRPRSELLRREQLPRIRAAEPEYSATTDFSDPGNPWFATFGAPLPSCRGRSRRGGRAGGRTASPRRF